MEEEKLICADCGKEITGEEYSAPNGDPICEDCYENYYTICDCCGRTVAQDDVTRVFSGYHDDDCEYWCEGCVDSHAFYCEDCDKYYDDRNVENYYTNRDRQICQYCRDDYHHYCDECGDLLDNEDDEYWDDDNNCYCRDCWENRSHDFREIQSYHDRPQMHYYYSEGEEQTNPFKGYGIELEIENRGNHRESEAVKMLNETLGEHVYYNRDGSLDDGFEVITQPHTEQALYEMNWEDALTKLAQLGYRSHNGGNCGLHMHVSRAMFGDTETERTDNIAKIVMFYELFWDDIRRFSRRTESQISSWASRYCIAHSSKSEEQCKSLLCRGQSRYHAVNLCNTNTIEFRINRGTLKVSTFLATLDFLITTVKNSKTISWDNINNKELWLQGIKDTTKEYMAVRGCFGYPPQQETEEEDEQ